MGQAATCDTPVCKPSQGLIVGDGPACIPTWSEELTTHPDLGGCQPCPRNQTVKVDIARILDEGHANLEFQKPLKPVAEQLEELRARIAHEEQRRHQVKTDVDQFPEVRRWDDRKNVPVDNFANRPFRAEMDSQPSSGSDDILYEVAAALRGARKAAGVEPPQAPPQPASPPAPSAPSAPIAPRGARPAEVDLLLKECERIRQEERRWHAKQAAERAPFSEDKHEAISSEPVAPPVVAEPLPVAEAKPIAVAPANPPLDPSDEPQDTQQHVAQVDTETQSKTAGRGRAASAAAAAAAAARRVFSSKKKLIATEQHI